MQAAGHGFELGILEQCRFVQLLLFLLLAWGL
jgi:hypothetical protein